MIAPHDPEGNQNEWFLFYSKEIFDTLSYIQYCKAYTFTEKRLLMSLLSYDDLIYKLSCLSKLADEIKEKTILENCELMEFCHRSASGDWMLLIYDEGKGPRIDRDYLLMKESELSACPAEQKASLESVKAIETEVYSILKQHENTLDALVNKVYATLKSITAGMASYLDGLFFDASKRNELVNDWYKRYYDYEFKKIGIDILKTYKYRKDEIPGLIETEKRALEANSLYEKYNKAIDPPTLKCDYGKFFASLKDRLKGCFLDADCLASLHDLFVSITKIEAYDALLDGQPLPSYKPLIPDEEEEEVAVPSTDIEEKSEQEKVDKPKSKQRKVKKFEDYFFEEDTRKKNEILIQLEKVVPTLSAKRLAAVIEYACRHGLLYAKPNHAEIERQFGKLSCSRQGLGDFKDYKFSDEELEFCKAFFKIKE